jgi:hypothetical protein
MFFPPISVVMIILLIKLIIVIFSDVNINALFDEETGIFFLLKEIMSCKELEKVKVECLQLLNMFCEKFKDHLLLMHVKQIRVSMPV